MTDKNVDYQTNSTEAWQDPKEVIKDTGVIVPTEDAVERAREWSEENEK